ncbi:MAG: DUF4340 domain-containing protein, partial [Clostridia bacterium]|nr:DUF4340 domain-containing protein [Clostridia bacterium]
DGFRLLGKEDRALRDQVVRDILNVCTDLTAEDTVINTAESPVNLADFQLSPAQVRVVIGYQDGEKKELRIGAPTPDEIPQRYCMVGEDAHIYSVLTADTDVFFHDVDYLRAFSQPELRGDLLDRITVTGEITFDAHYTLSGWIMDAPYRYPLGALRTDALLQNIEKMAFESCLGTDQEVDVSLYGLDRPALTVTLDQAATVVTGETADGQQVSVDVPEMRYTLMLGDETGKSGVYVLWNHEVYRASNFLLGFWKEMNVDALLLREPVNLLVNNLNRVTFSVHGKTVAYEVQMVEVVTQNNQIAVDEYGRTLYDAAVRRMGEDADMDAETFLSWYQRLAALAPAGTLPTAYVPQGEPWAQIILENDTLTREIAFYAYDALHSAMAVDGVCRFYVENSTLQALSDDAP